MRLHRPRPDPMAPRPAGGRVLRTLRRLVQATAGSTGSCRGRSTGHALVPTWTPEARARWADGVQDRATHCVCIRCHMNFGRRAPQHVDPIGPDAGMRPTMPLTLHTAMAPHADPDRPLLGPCIPSCGRHGTTIGWSAVYRARRSLSMSQHAMLTGQCAACGRPSRVEGITEPTGADAAMRPTAVPP